MYSKQALITATLVIASQLRGANAWAYAFGITESYLCDNFGNCQAVDQAQCFSNTPGGCGNCGIQAGLAYNTDITNPSVYQNDDCGNPCVTYDSDGLTQDDLNGLAANAPAGTITVAATSVTMNCKKDQSKDCSEFGVFGNVENDMYIVCDPSI
jgi:hypothetical protein